MSFSVQFHGAAETVTGSCHLVTYNNVKFLIDCGMFQGPDVEIRNLEPFGFNPAEIDFVLLTHTHIDHSGLLPKLVRGGFRGEIFATYHSCQLAPILLLDSAKIQENNYKEGVAWKHAGKVALVYDSHDADVAISLLKPVELDTEFEARPGVKVKYMHAGHVLGAASIEIEMDGKVIVFSGDIGRVNHELIGGFDQDYSREVDYVVMEALYGGQTHPSRPEAVRELTDAINETLQRGGSVFIPCFAVQRTQELLHDLKFAKQSGALPMDVPVWLDSPMAQKVTEVYRAALDHSEDSLFEFPELRFVKAYRQSQKISKRSGQIIMAGSGMADGGRILDHLVGNLNDERDLVAFVGYQAEATIGRALVEGTKELVIQEKAVRVRAEIRQFQGFSAHGDTTDLTTWVQRYNSSRLKKIMLVHAEKDRAEALQAEFTKLNIDHPQIAKWQEKIEL